MKDVVWALAVPANGRFCVDFTEGDKTFHAEVQALPGGGEGMKLLVIQDMTSISSVAITKKNIIFGLLHILRTPLTSVVNVLRMATQGSLDTVETDSREILALGLKEADRLTGLLTSLKDLALIETSIIDDEISLDPVPVREILAEVADGLRPRLAGKAQTLQEDYPLEPIYALAEREALVSALGYVLDNAHRFTQTGGTISLSVEVKPERVILKIDDNGPGIAPEDLPLVFERFRRGTGDHVRAAEGEGLGLYLARHLLLAQRSTIVLDSKPDSGTSVEITLLRRDEP